MPRMHKGNIRKILLEIQKNIKKNAGDAQRKHPENLLETSGKRREKHPGSTCRKERFLNRWNREITVFWVVDIRNICEYCISVVHTMKPQANHAINRLMNHKLMLFS